MYRPALLSRPALTLTVTALLSACGAPSPAPAPARPDGLAAQALSPTSLGARYTDAAGTATGTTHLTFRVYSSRATRLEVNLYAARSGADEKLRYTLTKNASTNVWSVTVPVSSLTGAGIGTVYYGYRAWGPNWPYSASWSKGSSVGFVSDVDASGNRFNPNKLLLDPYALEVSHDPQGPASGVYSNAVYATGAANRALDSGRAAPKGIVLSSTTAAVGTRPTRSLKDDVVYEVHLRGLTKGDASVSCAGTYAGAAARAASLKALGVTAVEFLPVQETDNDANDVTDAASGRSATGTTGDNYWGYMTTNYFAPDRRYACDQTAGGPTKEFRAMVKSFHDQGIKVFIDVVYNHTAEGGTWGPNDTATILSWRGLDNAAYYTLTGDGQNYWDNTGIGANFNTFGAAAQNLIVDSLKYWRDELGVDGFRFDLASVLGNTCTSGCFNYDKMNAGTALNRITRDLTPRPVGGGSGVDLIAEPWAIGGNSYQVGNFPSGWSEWNGQYRDTLRRDQNKMGVEAVTPGQLASRLSGSSDLYGDDGRRPQHSVNFMVAHDGFTHADLYRCTTKNNTQAWPYGPSDGGEDNNHSWDQGGVAADQRKAARNGMALLLLSAGTPMLTGGDEILRSVNCNNNPYNLDSSANWLPATASADGATFRTFTQKLLAFRAAHPALRPANFYAATDTNGNAMEQLRWFRPDGAVADSAYFNDANNHALAYRLDGTEFADPAGAIYVAYNGWSGNVNFTLPWPGAGRSWYRVTDTCSWAEGAGQLDLNAATGVGGENATYGLCGRGMLVLVAR